MPYVASALAYLVGAFWVTRPIFSRFADAIPVGTAPPFSSPEVAFVTGDPHQLLFYMWLFVRNLRAGEFAFADTTELAGSNASGMHLTGSWGFPLQAVYWALHGTGLSIEAVYNLCLLATYPLVGVSTMFCLRRLGASRIAAFLAGLVYAFCVFRHTQLVCGHANAFIVCLFPWAYLALSRWRGAGDSRTQIRWALVLGAALFFMALGEWHVFYYTSLFAAAVAAAWAVRYRDMRFAAVKKLAMLGPAALLALAGFLWVRWFKSFGLDTSPVAQGRSSLETMNLTPLPLDFLHPWVRFTREVVFSHNLERRSYYIGLSLIAVIAIAVWQRRRTQQIALDAERPALVWLAAVAAVLIFSPFITPLFALLKVTVPYWAFVRVKGRIAFALMFALAALGAWALDRLRTIGWRRLVPIAVCVAIADFVVLTPTTVLSRGPLPSTVLDAAAPAGSTVLYLPLSEPDATAGSASFRFAMLTGHTVLNGYEPTAPTAAFVMYESLRALNEGSIGTREAGALRRYGVRHVVVDHDVLYGKNRDRMPVTIRDALTASGLLRVAAADEHYTVLELTDPARP